MNYPDAFAALRKEPAATIDTSQLADDLDLLAEERAELGDAREANELRQRAKTVRQEIADREHEQALEALHEDFEREAEGFYARTGRER